MVNEINAATIYLEVTNEDRNMHAAVARTNGPVTRAQSEKLAKELIVKYGPMTTVTAVDGLTTVFFMSTDQFIVVLK